MDILFKIMDIFFKFIGHHSRQFNLRPQVLCMGYFASKKEWIDHRFDTCNFSFILNGEGEYRKNGKLWQVKGPCVLTQWPEELQNYGPHEEWEEFFIVYDGQLKNAFKTCKFLLDERPVWYIDNFSSLESKFNELKALILNISDRSLDSDLDRIDALSEHVIMESIIREKKEPYGDEENIIFKIQAFINRYYLEQHDFEALAKKNGMSSSTFRRYWTRLIKEPPGQYILNLRIREALRLLVETDYPIGQIADRLNFQDPLYFSRLFKKKIGMTASRYREINQKSLNIQKGY